MKNSRKNMKESLKLTTLGFTLVELLAVIAVLALILIIAVPKITKTMDNSKKRTLELSVKSIASAAEKAYIENKTYGIKDEITCESVTNMSKNEYESCNIKFDTEGNATVTIKGKANYKGLNVCDGTKNDVTISNNRCGTPLTVNLDGGFSSVNNNGEYKVGSTVTLTEPTKEGYVFKGWSATGASINGNTITIGSNDITVKATWVKLISFTISSTTYQAEEGMTWGEWLISKYNIGGYLVNLDIYISNSDDTSLSRCLGSSAGYGFETLSSIIDDDGTYSMRTCPSGQ